MRRRGDPHARTASGEAGRPAKGVVVHALTSSHRCAEADPSNSEPGAPTAAPGPRGTAGRVAIALVAATAVALGSLALLATASPGHSVKPATAGSSDPRRVTRRVNGPGATLGPQQIQGDDQAFAAAVSFPKGFEEPN